MTQEFSNDKKQRLLDTAFSLFSDKGIKNTSIQEIVDSANVAKGTFYLYFKECSILAHKCIARVLI